MIWHRLLQTAAIATVFFSTATVFDFAHRNIELFAHFRPQYLAVSVLLLIVFAALRKPVYAMLLLGSSAINASFVVPWYVGGAPISDDPDIRILSANVQGRHGE